MRCNRFGLRIFTLCLTFWSGLFAADLLNTETTEPSEEIKPQEIKRAIITFDPKQLKYNSFKPICKKFYDDFDRILIDEKLTPAKESAKIKDSKKQKASQKPDISEDAKLAELVRKEKQEILKRLEKANPETAHNLLYVENCAEYY